MAAVTLHETYMKRCLDLAGLGLGSAAPNPMVGSVIVHNNKIIGEGYHMQYGGHHAEVNAVHAVKDKSLLGISTLYVNLEPCSHSGKTPPCAEMIIKNKIPEVFIGTTDPNHLVSGNGIRLMEASGTKVITGIMKEQCCFLNRRFFTFHVRQRPYIILKWAQSNDGFIDVLREKSGIANITWITNEISRMVVHKWRSEEQAILVGTQTALMDNPRLSLREWPGRSPIRIVIDRKLRLPKKLNLFDNSLNTLVFNEKADLTEEKTHYVCLDFQPSVLESMLKYLHGKGIQSVLVEGGRKLINSFIQENLWDEARVFIGKKQFGSGVLSPVIEKVRADEYQIREDTLHVFHNNLTEIL